MPVRALRPYPNGLELNDYEVRILLMPVRALRRLLGVRPASKASRQNPINARKGITT